MVFTQGPRYTPQDMPEEEKKQQKKRRVESKKKVEEGEVGEGYTLSSLCMRQSHCFRHVTSSVPF